MQTKMAWSCDQKRRRICGKESENGGWIEKEGKTEKEMGGLYQRGLRQRE